MGDVAVVVAMVVVWFLLPLAYSLHVNSPVVSTLLHNSSGSMQVQYAGSRNPFRSSSWASSDVLSVLIPPDTSGGGPVNRRLDEPNASSSASSSNPSSNTSSPVVVVVAFQAKVPEAAVDAPSTHRTCVKTRTCDANGQVRNQTLVRFHRNKSLPAQREMRCAKWSGGAWDVKACQGTSCSTILAGSSSSVPTNEGGGGAGDAVDPSSSEIMMSCNCDVEVETHTPKGLNIDLAIVDYSFLRLQQVLSNDRLAFSGIRPCVVAVCGIPFGLYLVAVLITFGLRKRRLGKSAATTSTATTTTRNKAAATPPPDSAEASAARRLQFFRSKAPGPPGRSGNRQRANGDKEIHARAGENNGGRGGGGASSTSVGSGSGRSWNRTINGSLRNISIRHLSAAARHIFDVEEEEEERNEPVEQSQNTVSDNGTNSGEHGDATEGEKADRNTPGASKHGGGAAGTQRRGLFRGKKRSFCHVLCHTWAHNHELFAPWFVRDRPGMTRTHRLTILLVYLSSYTMSGTILFFWNMCYSIVGGLSNLDTEGGNSISNSDWWLLKTVLVILSLVVTLPIKLVVRWVYRKNELSQQYVTCMSHTSHVVPALCLYLRPYATCVRS